MSAAEIQKASNESTAKDLGVGIFLQLSHRHMAQFTFLHHRLDEILGLCIGMCVVGICIDMCGDM